MTLDHDIKRPDTDLVKKQQQIFKNDNFCYEEHIY